MALNYGSAIDHSTDIACHVKALNLLGQFLVVGEFGVILDNVDFIVEETGSLGGGMGNQGFLFRESQVEVSAKECFDSPLDFQGFLACSGISEKDVIGIAHVPQSAIVGIIRVSTGQLLSLPFQLAA